MRKYISFDVENPETFKQKLVHYSSLFNYAAIYDSCKYYESQNSQVNYHSFNFLAGLDSLNNLTGNFDIIQEFRERNKDWSFGYWGYDLKNNLEQLYSVNSDGLYFNVSCFFQPRFVIENREDNWTISYDVEVNTVHDAKAIIEDVKAYDVIQKETANIQFKARVSKDKYCQSIGSVLDHIHKGDIYELNYCMEFFAEKAEIDPCVTYNKLIEISPTPFSSFLKLGDKYVLCASPERYLKKEGNKLISQPIKGTAKRGLTEQEDQQLKNQLNSCIKERSENIMIADLVRNDLSRVAERGSVEVEELCGIYPFKQVFQMISTVVARLGKNKSGMDAIKSSFPPGSMTGAPKIRAMKLIEKYEETKRGAYSGSVGYFTPEGDFDFNVVIRSLLYNKSNKYLSFMVGSAITEKSIAQNEYDECLLKAKAILQLFNQENLLPND